MTPACRFCTHAEGRPSSLGRGWMLWCVRHRTLAQRACGDWQREPGSDDE